MKLQEGPLFGASIIGVGVGFLLWQSSGNIAVAVGIGALVAVADYALLVWIKSKSGK